ncbi:MAG: hypothetical protein WD075_06180 [Rhodospirillales bacterium]
MIRKTPALFILISVLWAPTSPRADNLESFNASVGQAYAAYRSASNYLRTGNPGLASLEIATALETWNGIDATFVPNPPNAYKNDPAFSSDLAAIDDALKDALKAAEDEDAKSALRLLEPIREQIYTLRKRNGIRLYADCITELNRAIEPLYVHRHKLPDLGISQIRAKMQRDGEIYADLLKDCRSMASEELTKDQEFTRLFDGTAQSIHSIFPAIKSGDPERVVNVLRELRSFDRIIYFRFGG